MTPRSRRALLTLLLAALALLAGWPARAQPASIHLTMGNPSGAVSDLLQPHNYLIVRDQYALAYDRDRGIPSWVSWHLDAADIGSVPRCDKVSVGFQPDTSLPTGWYQVKPSDYTGSGYDRGHMTPSADRSGTTQADNCTTFLMTNVLPQAPQLNQGLWADLEGYARTLVGQGDELYIIAGGSGALGTLAGGKLTIPAATWKVMLALPDAAGDDVARVTAQTQVIAIWAPNDASTQGQSWQSYTTTVACVQQRTGLDFFAALDDTVEAAIEGGPCPSAGPGSDTIYLPIVTDGSGPTPTPAPASVAISFIDYAPASAATDEYVTITNSGGGPADLSGWTLSDLAGNTYTFPAFTLAAGAEVRVWTKAGTDNAGNLYWGRGTAVWNNSGGDTATLRDAGGALVDSYSYT